MIVVPAIAAILTSGTPAASAQLSNAARADTLRGRVESADGAPLEGVEVTIVELDRRTISDAGGAFFLADLAPGRYSVLARAAGFAPAFLVVSLPRPAELTIRLSREAFALPPLTVTATRGAEDPRLTTRAADELGPEQLRRENGVSLAHALEALSGVHTLSTGEQVGKPVIRGLTGPRVLVLGDGIRLEDYSWSDEDGPSVDTRLADRVEVIRGAASVLYGSDALGGVVNVIPAPLPDGSGRAPFVAAGLEAYGATNNREFGGAACIESAAGGFSWRAFGVGRFAEDLRTPGGRIENTGFGSAAGEGAVGLRGGWGAASLRFTHFGGEFKLLEADAPLAEAELEGGPERKLADDRVQLGADLPVAARLRLEAKGQWQRHSLVEVGDTPGAPPGQETTQFDLLLNTATAELLAHHEIGTRVTGTVGVSGLLQDNDSRGPLPIVPDARVRAGALFGFEQAAVGAVRLSAGARVDLRRLDVDPDAQLGNVADTRTYSVASASGGIAYTPMAGLAVRANVGRGWRAPTLFELYANGPRIGEAIYEIGRADLTPESALDLDGGAEYVSSTVRVAVSAYRNRIDDFIYLGPTGEFRDSLRVYAHGQAPAVLWGGEVVVNVRPVEPLMLHARAAYVNGTNTATDEPLPLMPPPSGAVGVEIGSERMGWAGRSYVSAETEVCAEQTRLSEFDVQTPAYALVNLDAGIGSRIAGRVFHVDLQVRNLLDTAYRSYLSRYKEFALDPGRNVLLRVGTTF